MSRPNSPITGSALIKELQRLPKEKLDKLPVYVWDADIDEQRAVLQVDLSIDDRIDLNIANIGEI